MASDTWRYPWTALPDYMGPGTPMEQYQKNRADLVTSPAPAAATPPATQNAVSAAQELQLERPAYPTEFRAGYEAGGGGRASKPTSPTLPAKGSVNKDTSPYPTLAPIMGPGERAATPSYPTIQFNAAPPQVAQAAAGFGGGLGMIAPQAQYQADDLFEEGRKLLSSAGIVDRLRGRQLLRQRSRLLEGATDIARTRVAGANAETGAYNAQAAMLGAQTGAFRATNEVPLALLETGSRRYGVDTNAAVERERIGSAAQIAAARDITDRRGQDLGFAPHAAEAARRDLVNRMYVSGDPEGASELAQIYTRERPDPRPQMTMSQDGSSVVVMRPGATTPDYFDLKAMQKQAEEKRKDALRK